jgi:hypothetical protein
MIQKETYTEHFAPVVWANLEAIRLIGSNKSDVKISQKLRNALNKTLRYWEEDHPKLISKKAMAMITNHNNNIKKGSKLELENFRYDKDRSKLGKNSKGELNIAFEHTIPVDQLIEDLMKCKSLEGVKMILNESSGVCIITREENNNIPSKYKKQRLEGWRLCYAECGIEIYGE